MQSLKEFKAACETVRFWKLQNLVLQLYLIWTRAQFLKHLIVLQRRIYDFRNFWDGVLWDIS